MVDGSNNPILTRIATRALEFVPDGAVVGLGSGRAALAFVDALAERVRCLAINLLTISGWGRSKDFLVHQRSGR